MKFNLKPNLIFLWKMGINEIFTVEKIDRNVMNFLLFATNRQ